ncbi:MAG: glycosyltransferase family 2 protein [Oscillospiraceae bacterium]|nr:glycosyltransferase family 2 protein [Oscillospiraceae bacterium]
MKVQVLVAAMHQSDYSLLEKMNIQSDAIVGNQCDRNSVEDFQWNGHNIRYLNFAERGVGLNRNNALMRADGDICLFADDDMRYCDGYAETLTKAFAEHPEADVLVFNLIEKDPTRPIIQKFSRVRFYNFLRYGTARVAVRNAVVQKHGVYFNQCFGGGTEHCHGEDNLFLAACLQKGLKVYALPAFIAELTEERPSSWNTGYDEKYLRDQGVLYRVMSRRMWKLWCLQDAIRHHKIYEGRSISVAYKAMLQGGLSVTGKK